MATTLEEYLHANIAEIEAVCGEGNSAKRVIGMALIQADKAPKIYDCDPRTTLNSIVQVTGMGLDLSLSAGEAYLTPRWNKDFVNEDKTKGRAECGFQTGYQGLIKLVSNNPKISYVQARVVYESELKDFELYYDPEVNLKHRPIKTGEPGKTAGFYALVKFTNGDLVLDYMTDEEVDKIRKMSRSPDSGPWKDHRPSMGKKTVIRRMCNALPKSAQLITALEVHDSDFDFNQEPDPKNSGDKSGKYASEEESKAWQEAMEKYVSERNVAHQKNWENKGVENVDILCTPRTADNALAQSAVRAGHLNRDTVPENGIQSRQYCKLTGIVDAKNRSWIRKELKRLMDDLERLANEKLTANMAAVAAGEPGGNPSFEDGE
jgi:recombination protein RecT